MDNSSNYDMCCTRESNIVESNGFYVCTRCSLVQDTLCFDYGSKFENDKIELKNSLLDELCHRLSVATTPQADSEFLYNKARIKNPNIQKLILLSCSLYIACKQNNCPRTMKEISGISGVDVKRIGQYEHLVCNQYYPTKPSDYVNRFAGKLDLKYSQIRRINQELEKDTNYKYNPVTLCAAVIYKTMKRQGIELSQLVNISGVPSSTIKRIAKKI